MDELLLAIFSFCLGFAVFAVVGHVCWLMLTSILKAIFCQRCKQCGKKHLASACPFVLPPQPQSSKPDVKADLAATRRLIQFSRFRNWLTPDQLSAVEKLVGKLQARIDTDVESPVPPKVGAPGASVVSASPPTSLDRPPVAELAEPASPVIDVASPLQPEMATQPQASQAIAPPTTIDPFADEPESTLEPKPPIRQRLTANLLKSFMEQSNIRWIEIISATLIVTCSVGLVISLWSTLSSTSRFFPSLVFLLATCAVHGAGQYTLRQWKLRSTSKGILHIGLMLIPLSVLVGILLSRRDNVAPTLDIATCSVIGVGALLYGALAITASRSLFHRRWPVVAYTTLIASLTLLPIHFLSENGVLDSSSSAWILIPLIAMAAFASLTISRSCLWMQSSSQALIRSSAMVTQCIFATLVTIVFWLFQLPEITTITGSWWVATGVLGACWVSWAWSSSLARLDQMFPGEGARKGNSDSWLIVVSWVAACALTIFLVAVMWQIADVRSLVALFLFLLAAYWLAHGWWCCTRASLCAGALSALAAAACLIEISVASSPVATFVEWIGFTRIVTWTLVGVAGVILSSLGLNSMPRQAPRPAQLAFAKRPTAPLRWVAEQFLVASGIVFATAAGLTLIASLAPWGATPFGGNWAPMLLTLYGCITIAAGIQLSNQRRFSGLVRFIVPAGQVILLIGVVRLFHSSPMLEQLVGSLRPQHAWTIGTSLLALNWAILAVTLVSKKESQRSNLLALCGGAILLIVPSTIASMTRGDYLHFTAAIGWAAPVTFLAVFAASRISIWREVAFATLTGWLCATLYSVGWQNDWWRELGVAPSIAVFIILITLVGSGIELALHLIRVRQSKTQQPSRQWMVDGPSQSVPALLVLCLPLIATALFAPGMAQLAASLGASELTGIDEQLRRQPGHWGCVLIVLSITALSASHLWLGRLLNRRVLIHCLAFTLPAFAMATAIWVAAPFALPAALGLLAVGLIASDLIPLWVSGWDKISTKSWNKMVEWEQTVSREANWLSLVRTVSLSLLFVGSAVFLMVASAGHVPRDLFAPGQPWTGSCLTLLITLGPLMAVLLVRWTVGVLSGEKPNVIATAGIAAGILFASVATLAHPSLSWTDALVVVIAIAALVTMSLAAASLTITLLRNGLGLRAVLPNKLGIVSLATRAMKGSRWKRIEQASWAMVVFSSVAMVALCMGAAVAVIAFPAEPFLSLDWLGGSLVSITATLSFALFWFLASSRGATHFGLLAICTGLIAPLGAVTYANALVKDPTLSYAAASNFEPYRLLVGLWISALVIGLFVRLGATLRDRPLRPAAELAWVLLAALVAALSLNSVIHDPKPAWAFTQLSVLALIATLSGAVSGQVWRGHIAAILAAAGIASWVLQNPSSEWLHAIWTVLWGPAWVGLVAITTKPALRLMGLEPQASKAGWSVDQTVSLHIPIVSAALSGFWLATQGTVLDSPTALTWWVVGLTASTLLLSASRLWDVGPSKRGLAVYLNLLATALVLSISLCSLADVPRLESWLIWLASGLGGMAAMAGLLRELSRESSNLSQVLRWKALPTKTESFEHALRWMPAAHTVASVLAFIPSVILVLAFEERALRVAATVLPFIGAIAILPIAGVHARSLYRYTGLSLISSTLVLLWWADLPSAWVVGDLVDTWIFVQRAFAALVVLGVAYPLLVSVTRLHANWKSALMRIGWVALILGAGVGCSMLAGQFLGPWRGVGAEASLGTKLLTLLAWTLVVGRLIQFAIRPTALEAGATESMRKASIYGAEVGLALLAAACYFHFPNLFSGVFVNWWPLVVFALAMLSAGIGEWMQRLKQPIVADPIRQSGLLLPLIPLAGVWWIQPESADWLWNEWGRYAILLMTAAGLYGMQGWLRESVLMRGLAACLALLSFWSLLYSQPSLRFFEHPQFWLLPPAIAVLAFVELNRKRLEASVVTAARYLGVLVAYLSSTAEIFMQAFEGQLWQPILLLTLSLCGVAAGVLMRVRAFLYCGSAFAMVALLGMVWHAQQAIGQIWPWWAFGIATGVALITCLGYFEKNRPQVLAYLEQFRQWEH